jgi:hypothetical protein
LGKPELVPPLAGADEQLQRPAFETGLMGNGFGGLTLKTAQFALENGLGMTALFLAVEAGEVALHELLQVSDTGRDIGRTQDSVLEQRLGLRGFEQIHGGSPKCTAVNLAIGAAAG